MNEHLNISEAIASIRNLISGYGAERKRLYEGVLKKLSHSLSPGRAHQTKTCFLHFMKN